MVNEELAEKMSLCSVDFPPGVNELEVVGLKTEPSSLVKPPRIALAPAALECREHTTLEIGRSRVILGQVVGMHVKDEFIDPAGPYVRAEQMHAIGRMNGKGAYVKTRDAFIRIPRLTYKEWLKDNPPPPGA